MTLFQNLRHSSQGVHSSGLSTVVDGRMAGEQQSSSGKALRVWRGKPVHARTADGKVDFRTLVGLYVGKCHSPSMNELNLVVALTFNTRDVNIDGNDYVFAFRGGILQIEINNGSIMPGSIYEHELQGGGIKVTSEADETRQTSKNIGVQASIDLGASLTGWISTISAGLRGGRNRSAERKETQIESKEERILLVFGAGQDSVQVGCPLRGDPRHSHGWLLGTLIDVADKDRPTPLCVIEAINPSEPIVVRLSFLFNPQRPCLFRPDNGDKGTLLESNLNKVNAEVIKRRIKDNENLKDHLAAFAACRDFLRERGSTGTDMLLASMTVAYDPRMGQHEDG